MFATFHFYKKYCASSSPYANACVADENRQVKGQILCPERGLLCNKKDSSDSVYEHFY